MKPIIKIICLSLLSFYASAQQSAKFKNELRAALKLGITNQMADSLIFRNYSDLLWFYDMSSDIKTYPLQEMSNDELYQNNLPKLFADTGQSINTLACLMAAAAKDTLQISNIEQILKRDNYKNMFAAKSLLMLNPTALLPVAKCIKAYDFNEQVQYLTIDFLHIKEPVLEQFARDSIFSDDKAMQYLSIKAMHVITIKEANEKLLKQAVSRYDTLMKGWPIAVLAEYKSSGIYELLKPYINHEKLRQVSLKALARSKDAYDRTQFLKLVDTKQVDADLLNALLNSEQETYIEKWLSLFKDGIFPVDYFFSYHQGLSQPKYFQIIIDIIDTNANATHLYSLMEYFKSNKDELTKAFLEKCLKHRFKGVREQAETLLRNDF